MGASIVAALTSCCPFLYRKTLRCLSSVPSSLRLMERGELPWAVSASSKPSPSSLGHVQPGTAPHRFPLSRLLNHTGSSHLARGDHIVVGEDRPHGLRRLIKLEVALSSSQRQLAAPIRRTSLLSAAVEAFPCPGAPLENCFAFFGRRVEHVGDVFPDLVSADFLRPSKIEESVAWYSFSWRCSTTSKARPWRSVHTNDPRSSGGSFSLHHCFQRRIRDNHNPESSLLKLRRLATTSAHGRKPRELPARPSPVCYRALLPMLAARYRRPALVHFHLGINVSAHGPRSTHLFLFRGVGR